MTNNVIAYPKTHSPWKRDDMGIFTDEASRPWVNAMTHGPFYATEKVDGTNTRFTFEEGVLGRTAKSEWDQGVLADLDAPYLRFLAAVNVGLVRGDAVLFGETVGPKLQGNPYGFGQNDPHEFVLFDVWSPSLGWAERHVVTEVAEAIGVRTPPPSPHINFGRAVSLQNHVGLMMRAVADGVMIESDLYPGFPAEGIVLRPLVELATTRGERIQLKLKVRDVKRFVERNVS